MSNVGQLVSNLYHQERERQDRRFPGQWEKGETENGKKLAILVEEVGEVARALYEHDGRDSENLLEELLHTHAVAGAWLESILSKDRVEDTVAYESR